ncbi:MAG: PPC domain-containing protein [Lentisphaerae bacterium]|nr:PPC domain-containing protein [Lentisphaerota bacterium]
MNKKEKILKESSWKILLSLVFAAFAFLNSAGAQNWVPHIGYVYPAGAQAGTNVTLVVGGMNFGGLKDASVSGGGVNVKSVKFSRPFNNLSNDLKNELIPILTAIEKGEDPIAASIKNSESVLSRLKKQYEADMAANPGGDKKKEEKPKDQNSYENMFKIVPGERLLYIDKTPEEVIKIIKDLSPLEYQCLCKDVFSGRKSVLQASPAIEQNAIIELEIEKDASPGIRELRLCSQLGAASNPLLFVIGNLPETSAPYFCGVDKNPVRIIETFPSIANGQILPGETDKFRFKAKAGEKYAFSLMGRKLMPYLGDAVPGWFQPVISVHDGKGKILEFSDDNLFDPDPVLGFAASFDGEYELRIRDSIYRGREDFVYRLKAEIGPPPQIEMKRLELDYEIENVRESEKNNSLSEAQAIKYPVLIDGAIDSPGDVDFFRIKAGKGDKIVAEVFARRLDSPLDSLIQIMDGNGKILFWNDDWSRLNVGNHTHHSDSYCLFEIPEDGEYFIKISDSQAKGGEKFKYKLRIDRPRPDFQIFMDPSVLNGSSGVAIPFTVNVFRMDGFDLPIVVNVENGPSGVKIDGNEIPPGVETISMTLSVPGTVKHGFYKIEVSAKAEIGVREISRRVVPTDDVMQAFLYRHLVPAENLFLSVINSSGTPFKKVPAEISVKSGEEQVLSFPCSGYKPKKDTGFSLELNSPPKGISIMEGGVQGENYVLKIKADAEMKPWKGNLIFQCMSENTKPGNPKKSRYLAGCLPAIPAKVESGK